MFAAIGGFSASQQKNNLMLPDPEYLRMEMRRALENTVMRHVLVFVSVQEGFPVHRFTTAACAESYVAVRLSGIPSNIRLYGMEKWDRSMLCGVLHHLFLRAYSATRALLSWRNAFLPPPSPDLAIFRSITEQRLDEILREYRADVVLTQISLQESCFRLQMVVRGEDRNPAFGKAILSCGDNFYPFNVYDSLPTVVAQTEQYALRLTGLLYPALQTVTTPN